MASRTLKVTINAEDGASQVFIKVGNSAKTMADSLEQAAKSNEGMKTLSDQIKSLDGEITTVGQALTGFGAGITAAVAVGVNQFAGFEAAMVNVGTIANVSEAQLASMSDQVRALAVELGASPTGLAEGLYDLVGSGLSASDAMEVLRTSTISARAGMTDASTTARAITAVLNAYGMEASEAGNISDLLFATMDQGVLTLDALANNLQNVLPVGAALKVEFEEISTAFALLTRQGFSAATAETGIAAFMRAALNPTEELTAAVERYGYASVEALVQAEGLVGLLEVLQAESGGSAAALNELLGTGEATTAVLGLMTNGGAEFVAMLETMNGAAQDGARTWEVFLAQSETTQASIDRMQAAFGDLSLTIGSVISPAVGVAADGLAGIATSLNSLSGPAQTVAVSMVSLAGATTLLGGSFLLLAPRIVETRTALATLRGTTGVIGVLSRSLGPLGLAFAGVSVAAIGVAEILANIEENASGVADGIGIITDEIERLKLAAQPETAEQLQSILDVINQQVDLLSGSSMEEVAEKLKLPPGTEFIDISGPGGLRDQVEEAGELVDDVSAHMLETLNSIPDQAGKQAYLDWINSLLSDIEYTIDGTNLDDKMREILTTPASEVPGVVGEATNWITDLVDTTLAGAGSVATAYGDIQASVAETADDTISLIDEILARQQELLEIGQALGGLDDPLSQASLAGIGGDAVILAENMTTAAAEAENMFRIIVSNTNAIKSQAEQTLSWADGLIAVRGEWSRLDELVQKGLITGESGVFDVDSQYAAAQDAYDSIAITTQTIADNLDAVQAIQAPLLAEAQERTARWTYELLQMDAAQQRVTLGWYDSATAAQAMEAQMLINAAAAGEMGAAGQSATQQFIEGAVAANPILEDMLTDLGLIARDHEGNLVINFDESARSEVDLLNESIRQLTDILDDGQLNGSIGMQVTGKEDVEGIIGVIEDVMAQDGQTVDIGVNVSFGDAGLAAAGGLTSLADQLNLPETIDVKANVEGGEDVTELAGAIREIPPSTSVIVDVTADDSEARDIAAYWAGYNGITFAQVEVAIIGNAGGADGVLTTIDNILSGGKTGYEVTIDLKADDSDLTSTIAEWSGAAGGGSLPGEASGPELTVRFVADDADVEATYNQWAALDGTTIATIGLDGDNSGALASMGEAIGSLSAIDGTSATLNTLGNNSNALSSIGAASAALAGIDGDSATVSINAVSNVGSVAGAAAAALAGIDGRTATTYIDTVYRSFGSSVGAAFGRNAHGGMVGLPQFAHGGKIPFWAGENGPEVAHFAGGGTALLPHEGLYAAPPMTYISPNNAVSNNYGGDVHVTVNHYGSGDREEMNRWAAEELVPTLERAVSKRFNRVRV